jgi:hypothetical protein
MSWPFGPTECPRCRFFKKFDEPQYDDTGYEIVGFCRNPRVGMELFRSKRKGGQLEPCPEFSPRGQGDTGAHG